MKHDITALDLLLYIYEETTYLKKMAIEHALANNADLRYELEQLRSSQTALPDVEDNSCLMQPPANVLNKILNYSRSTAETCR